MSFILVNNFNTTLSAASSSTATTFTVSSSANLPTLATGEVLPITLNDAATRLVFEICYVTSISSNVLTVERAQEGTSAQNWNVGDFIWNGPTAGTALLQNTTDPFTTSGLITANGGITVPNATANNEPVALGQFSATLALPGYQKLPNGLIIQWLTLTGPVGSGTAFNWPIAFPNKVLSANATDTGLDAYRYGIGSASQTGGTMYALGGTTGASATCFCTAIGY